MPEPSFEMPMMDTSEIWLVWVQKHESCHDHLPPEKPCSHVPHSRFPALSWGPANLDRRGEKPAGKPLLPRVRFLWWKQGRPGPPLEVSSTLKKGPSTTKHTIRCGRCERICFPVQITPHTHQPGRSEAGPRFSFCSSGMGRPMEYDNSTRRRELLPRLCFAGKYKGRYKKSSRSVLLLERVQRTLLFKRWIFRVLFVLSTSGVSRKAG